MSQLKTLLQQTENFGSRLTSALEKLGIYKQCAQLELDHICVRLDSAEKARELQQELRGTAQEISVAVIAGREISIFQLEEPLVIKDWNVYGIELPYPKENHNYPDGWEHAEFVLPSQEHTMDALRDTFFQAFSHLAKDTLKQEYGYKENEPSAESDQLPNPTIGLKIGGVGVKFHTHSIQKVVNFYK